MGGIEVTMNSNGIFRETDVDSEVAVIPLKPGEFVSRKLIVEEGEPDKNGVVWSSLSGDGTVIVWVLCDG